jgi:hypothetical protein
MDDINSPVQVEVLVGTAHLKYMNVDDDDDDVDDGAVLPT